MGTGVPELFGGGSLGVDALAGFLLSLARGLGVGVAMG